MTPAQVQAAREAMRRLKFHPRESLPNRTSLERADALYAELTGDLRSVLGDAIAGFRAQLEGQDPARIDAARRSLDDLVKRIGVGGAG